ncbi:MAG: hypothetical protein N2422_07905, partial [Rhodobacteraceae bacterium]|nr:hypothetical protein [Paracoccaceae bacterium]
SLDDALPGMDAAPGADLTEAPASAEPDLVLIRALAAESSGLNAANAPDAPASAPAVPPESKRAFWRLGRRDAAAGQGAAAAGTARPDAAAAPPAKAAAVLRAVAAAPVATLFVAATLAPAVLLPLAALQGPLPLLLMLAYVVALALLFEDLKAEAEAQAPGLVTRGAVPAVAGLAISATAGAALFFAAGGGGIGALGVLLAIPAFAIWLGQVGAAFAHDLALGRRPWHRWLGTAFFAIMLLPHHASVLRTVHRRLVATIDDPYTADADEGFWEYYSGAWEQGSLVGFEMERNLMRPRLGHRRSWLHPYVLPCLLSLALVFLVPVRLGLGGLFGYLLVAGLVQIQIFATLYVRHFGCERRRIGRSRIEPPGPAHARVGAPVLDRLPFARSGRPAAGRAGSPVLPLPMPVMAAIALVPPVWRRQMEGPRPPRGGRLAQT